MTVAASVLRPGFSVVTCLCRHIAFAATAPAAAPTPTPATALLIIFATVFADFVFKFVVVRRVDQIIFNIVFDDRFKFRAECGRRATGFHRHARAFQLAIGLHVDRDAIAVLNLTQFAALAIQHIKGRFLAGAQDQLAATTAGRLFLQHAQRRQAGRRCRADKARAFAMRAFPR